MPKYLVDHDHDSVQEEVRANSPHKAVGKIAAQEYGEDIVIVRGVHVNASPEWFYVYRLDDIDPMETYIVVEVTDADNR